MRAFACLHDVPPHINAHQSNFKSNKLTLAFGGFAQMHMYNKIEGVVAMETADASANGEATTYFTPKNRKQRPEMKFVRSSHINEMRATIPSKPSALKQSQQCHTRAKVLT